MSNFFQRVVNKILTEEVNVNQVTQALSNHNYVMVNYEGEGESGLHKGKRIIQLYAYGLTKAGNPCIRAYQTGGDTFRGEPKWKLFRLDRILSWQTMPQTFIEPPREQGWKGDNFILPPEYNENGDRSMSVIYQLASFKGITDSDKEENANNNLINGIRPNIQKFGRNEKGQFDKQYNYIRRNMKNDERPEDLMQNDKYWNQDNNSSEYPDSGPVNKDKNGNDVNEPDDFEDEESSEDEWMNGNHNKI